MVKIAFIMLFRKKYDGDMIIKDWPIVKFHCVMFSITPVDIVFAKNNTDYLLLLYWS